LGERTLAELADGDRDTSHAGASADTVPPAEKVAYDLPETFGRYRIIEKLGEGGMGSVYLAHDTQLDCPVALKVPQFSPQDGPQVLQRFLREAQAWPVKKLGLRRFGFAQVLFLLRDPTGLLGARCECRVEFGL
jgi:hypothetical protein